MVARTHTRARTPRGYTLAELIIVLGVLGLAATLLIPHLTGQASMTVQAAVRRVVSDLSFAQSDALAHQEMRRIHFYEDGSGYCIYRVTEANFNDDFDPDLADYIVDPLQPTHQYIVDFVADERFEGVTITAADIDGGSRRITYDQLGGTIMPGNAPGIGGTIEISSDEGTYEISIAPFTGKLTVTQL